MLYPKISGPYHFTYDPVGVYLELFSFLIIIFSCFIIYYKTREIYNLTEHKGIKYFRKGFLFFAFAHILRAVFFILGPEIAFDLINKRVIFATSIFFALISVLYLLSSMYSKKIKEYYIYMVPLILIFLSYLFKTPFFVLISGLGIALSFGILSYINYKKSRRKIFSQIYIIYLLLFTYWIVIWIGQTITSVLELSRYYISIISAIFFLIILCRVLKRLKLS